MKRSFVAAMLAASALALTGCATTFAQQDCGYHEARSIESV